MPSLRSPLYDAENVFHHHGRQAIGGLIEDDQLRSGHEASTYGHHLKLAAAEGSDQLACSFLQDL